MSKDLIDTNDLSRDDLNGLIDLIGALKTADRDGAVPPLLTGRSLAMLFEQASTRTRVSFEVAMTKLGGHALFLRPGELHLGQRETLGDTAEVLSRMCDGIMARVALHQTIVDLAAIATVPVINGSSDFVHPTQAICDVFTMSEHRPADKALEDCTVVFVGDKTQVCSSLLFTASTLGMHFVHAGPSRYRSPDGWLALGAANLAVAGRGSVTVTVEVELAVASADFIYTVCWWWEGQEVEIPERQEAFMPRYQVNESLMAHAPAEAKFMHCLPVSRGVEATDEVIDSDRSIVFDQAENRLHTQMALLVWFLLPTLQPDCSQAVRDDHAASIAGLLEAHGRR
jgi:putrescine carbamoyltransferase